MSPMEPSVSAGQKTGMLFFRFEGVGTKTKNAVDAEPHGEKKQARKYVKH